MADRNLSVEEIIEQYSQKSSKKSEKDAFDLDSFINSMGVSGASRKTEVIEDVLEIGDNSFVFDPGEGDDPEHSSVRGSAVSFDTDVGEDSEPSAAPESAVSTDSLRAVQDAAPAARADVPSAVRDARPSAAQQAEPSAPAVHIPSAAAEDGEAVVKPQMPQIKLRVGTGTTQGTQAIEKVMENREKAKAFLSDEEEKPSSEAAGLNNQAKQPISQQEAKPTEATAPRRTPQEPDNLRPITGKGADTAIMQTLIKLKNERGTGRAPSPKVDPVNRASINDIDLGIEKKVIPNTEMGIDENASEEEKLAYLNAKRRERVKEFISESEEEEKPQKGSVADFESFDQAEEMSASISGLKQSLVARLCVLLVMGIVSAYLTIAVDNSMPIIPILSQSTAHLFVNVMLGLVSCFVSYTVIAVGIKKLFTLKADSDSLAAVTAIFSLVAATAMLANSELVQNRTAHAYVSAAILALIVNTIGKLLIITRTERNFKYISGGYSKYAAMHIDNEDVAAKFTKGALTDFPSLATARKTEFVRDFINNSYSPDLTDSFSKFYVPIAAVASILVGVLAVFIHPEGIVELEQRTFYALSCAAGTMCAMSAMGMMLVTNIPLAKASKKYLQSSAVMLGYSAVDKFADTNSLLVDAIDLFPDGMVEIVNLKPAKKASLEEGILYAASLCCQTESILRPAFYKMIKGKTEMLHPVESYIYEDGLGLSGWIENKRVLFGNRTLMESHSVEGLPTPEKEKEYSKGDSLTYLSIGGNVAMIFVVKLKASVSVSRALADLEKQNITVILRSVDSLLSITRLSEMFEVSPNTFKLLPFRYHSDYDSQTSYVAEMSSPMIYSGRFASLAMLLIGAKRLQRSATAGIVIQVLSAVIGLIACIVFAAIGSFGSLFTGTVMIAYSLVWIIITAVVQSVSKT
jgi:Cu+-exporting ATPase